MEIGGKGAGRAVMQGVGSGQASRERHGPDNERTKTYRGEAIAVARAPVCPPSGIDDTLAKF